MKKKRVETFRNIRYGDGRIIIAERISARQYKSGSILGPGYMYVRSVICAGAYE